MEACQHFQDLLLDSLYGLLEAGEDEAVRAHVAVCPDCAAAMEDARGQHEILAQAAQIIDQVPEFVAPDEQISRRPVAQAEPVVLPLPVAKKKRPWKRWLGVSVAAALLLAAGTGWTLYQHGLDDYRAGLARARKQVEAIDAQFLQAQDAAREAKVALVGRAPIQVAHLQVVGSASYEPDAPSPLRIMTRDGTGKPLPSQIVTRLVSAESKELFRSETASQGDLLVSLPAGLTTTGNKAQLEVEAASGEIRAKIKETIQLKEPALVTHLALNKSVFQVGEVLFFRTLTLERFSLKPVAHKIPLFFTLLDAKGRTVKQIPGQTGAGGVGGGEFALSKDLAAGEYTLRITQAGPGPRMLPQERKVEILHELPPQVHFDRAQYFAGETGKAKFMSRLPAGGGGFAKTQELEIKSGPGVSLNNAAPGAPVKMRTDARGNATIPFKLPANVDETNALLKILVQDGKKKEKVTHPIPVVASNLAVDFYPEGGDLLAGVPNRVYYRIRTPLGEPVNNPQGSVIILSMREPKKVILNVEQKQGLGMFSFTPDVNETYRLWVTYPTGVTETPDPFQKIKIQTRGLALNVPQAVSREGEPLSVVLHNTDQDRRLAIVATCRGRVVAEEFLVAGKGPNKITIAPVAGTRGLVRLTVYDASANTLTPLAERLVYRVPAEQLRLSVTGLKEVYRKGERANLRFEATDERGRKSTAWIGSAVVDERALLPADLEAPSPQAHFFLFSEVRRPEDLENADLLLADSPQGRKALDLFLGTQGWRRFVPADANQQPAMFARDNAKAVEEGTIFSRENNSPAALAALHDARLKESLDLLSLEFSRKRHALAQEKDQRIEDARLAAIELARFQNLPAEVLRLGAGFLVLALIVAGVLFLVWGLSCMQRRASPTIGFVGSCCSFLVCLILFSAAGSLPAPTAVHDHLLTWMSTKAWPAPENMQVEKTSAPRTLSTGVFALAPAKQGEKSATPPLSTSSARATSRGLTQLAKADNRTQLPLVQMDPQFQDRFFHALTNQDKLAKAGKSKDTFSHPALMAGKGKGGAAEAKKNYGDLAREYPYAYRDHTHSPTVAANVPATLLWHPNLFAADGSAQVSFDFSSTGATYRIILFGNTPTGRLGSFQGKLQTSK